ncbi:MAG: M48 family metallopeptidase [Magnetococcales bacterium]|nr:M48 family metallopeptidase [Magnetococcales bacterium]
MDVLVKSLLKPFQPDPRKHQGEIRLVEGSISYTLFRVPRRKRLTLRVTREAEVEVRGPVRVGIRRVEAFVREHVPWIQARLGEAQAVLEKRPVLGDGAALPFLDERLVLRFLPPGRGGVKRFGEELQLPEPLPGGGQLTWFLERWYRRAARDHFRHRLDYWAEKMGVRYGKLTVRGQKTRWGSCSARGDISLNWRLMMASSEVVDYVVIHELAHLTHRHHAPPFWAIVAQFAPHYSHAREKLKGLDPIW